MKKFFTFIAVVAMATVANATPYKNLHVEAEIYPAGSGLVYLDPTEVNENFVQEQSEDYAEKVTLKGTFGETANKTNMANRPTFVQDCTGDLSNYPVLLTIVPADGWEFVCVANEISATGEYTPANCYITYEGTTIEDFVFSFDYKMREQNPINANSALREEDSNAETNLSDYDIDRQNEAWNKGGWHETPDTKYYVIMRREGETTPSFSAESTGIINLRSDKTADGKEYNVVGMPVNADVKGIVIKNGKKYVK